jgi:type IV fimbrial biogenesis protein FimT
LSPFRPKSPAAPSFGERGFSLVELMVSIALMSIMFAIGVPALARYMKTNKLLGSTANLAGELRLARQRAVSEENNVVFSWNLTDDKYQWFDDDDNDGTADSGEYASEWRQLPDEVDLEAGDTPLAGTSVTLAATGTASQGGPLKISNAAGQNTTLHHVQVSGLVKVLS